MRWIRFLILAMVLTSGFSASLVADVLAKTARSEYRHQEYVWLTRLDKALHGGEECGPLRCRLSLLPEGKDEDEGSQLQVELVNASDNPVPIWFAESPLEHVHYILRDRTGEVVGRASCTDRVASYAPSSYGRLTDRRGWPLDRPPSSQSLRPGEVYSETVTLLDYCGFKGGQLGRGTYSLEAVFVYADVDGYPAANQWMVARSNPLTMRIRPWQIR